MHLIKDSSIVVTKTQHTAEEFIQKKIELLVRHRSSTRLVKFIPLLPSLSFYLSERWGRTFLCRGSGRRLQQTYPLDNFDAACPTTLRYSSSPSHPSACNHIAPLAVKCNDDINVIKLLAYLGAGFDCASKVSTVQFLVRLRLALLQGEIKKVMDIGVSGLLDDCVASMLEDCPLQPIESSMPILANNHRTFDTRKRLAWISWPSTTNKNCSRFIKSIRMLSECWMLIDDWWIDRLDAL